MKFLRKQDGMIDAIGRSLRPSYFRSIYILFGFDRLFMHANINVQVMRQYA